VSILWAENYILIMSNVKGSSGEPFYISTGFVLDIILWKTLILESDKYLVMREKK
jgi:hypothetical protein